ncbi:glycosyltransferase [Candidatus Nanohalococcus occultus]|uniref:glycosyltransferase n=1 Tax=Candidatus Nanohalococcus occultus TaxID=2978047 RepID=UPI0039E18E15
MGLLTLTLAFALIGSSVFFAAFYISVFLNDESKYSETVSLDSYPKLTIVMPAFNEEGVVRTSLSAVQNLDYPNYEVKFVDDGSTDGTLEIAKEMIDESITEIIESSENEGKAAALNKGLDSTDSEYMVVVDADSKVDGPLLKEAVETIEVDSNIGAVISAIMPLNSNTLVRRLQVVEYRLRDFYRNLMADVQILDVTPGAFSMYRTRDLNDIGGFDVGNLTEDLEMAWSLRKHGRDIEMVRKKRSYTELPGTLKGLHNQRVRWARGHIQNLFKHKDMFFNSRYGWFGLFHMPATTMFAGFSILGFVMVLWGLGEQAYNLFITFSSVGFKMPSLEFSLVRWLLALDMKVYVPLASSLGLTAYIMTKAYQGFGEEVKHPVALAVYFFGYFMIKPVFWISAILKELLRTKRTWT